MPAGIPAIFNDSVITRDGKQAMARIIHSTDILCDATARIESDSIHYTGGSLIAGLPALYDKHGHFVEVVNLWFLELKTVRHLIDINSSVRALLRYWSFLEKETCHGIHSPLLTG